MFKDEWINSDTCCKSDDWLSVKCSAKTGAELVRYDAMVRAIAAAKSVDEVKKIRVQASAMAAAARVAKNKDAEADCVVIRMRATRRLDQMRQAQKDTVGLATGGDARRVARGKQNPEHKPTLAAAGIDKNLAKEARVLGKLSDKEFEQTVADTRDAVTRAVRTVVRGRDIEQQRKNYTDKIKQGGTVADLEALAASGFRAGVIYVDAPWPFEAYSEKGLQRAGERYYDTMTVAKIAALPVAQLAAKNCTLFLWGVCRRLPDALEVIKAWGFEFKTVAFIWIKTTKNAKVITLDGKGLHWGLGYTARANAEYVLYATKGSPRRKSVTVHSVVIAPVGEHSVKPEEVRKRIERLYGGPYLELFARRPVEGWTTWGNEVSKGK
jgi:N6-adenosine-specific RNA methylase IME4